MDRIILSECCAAAANLNLAEKHFKTRFEELRSLVLAEEAKFKYIAAPEHVDDFYLNNLSRAILSEIDDIRAGRWDDEIEATVTGVPIQSVRPESGATVCVNSAIFCVMFTPLSF
jgi:bromodomain-containing protein 8